MQIEDRLSPEEVSNGINQRIRSDVHIALNSVKTTDDKFIINDTLWYFINPQNVVKPTVVNSAKFISKTFQRSLQNNGWSIDINIEDQEIDGYIELKIHKGFYLIEDKLGEFLQCYWDANPQIPKDSSFNYFFQRYYKRSCFSLPNDLPKGCQEFFQESNNDSKLRVGLEFETGNIASSFRAITKLAFLYNENQIDAAIFITSKDKNSTATRIWPVSNRNGSFEELEHRNYKRSIFYPLWEFSFSPDRLSTEAPYLSSQGTTYAPEPTGREIVKNNRTFDIYIGEGGREILLPKPENTIF